MLYVIDKKSTLQISEFIRNTALDLTQYNLTQNEMDLAVRLNYQIPQEPHINEKLYKYAKVEVAQIHFDFVVIDD